MEFDALILSRIQFAFTISAHVVFAALSIGLAAWLVLLEGLFLSTGRRAYKRLFDFWITLFAIAFALGAVSGIAMSYQFGANWSRFTEATANVLGPLLGYEVLAAFFLQASFLGIMLFGGRLVGRGLHFLATCIVAIGTLVAAFSIIAANSWMHSPDGYELRDGVFHVTDWMAVIFNPTMPYRFVHMTLAAWTATAFLVAGVGAWLALRGRARPEAVLTMKWALGLACILVPLQAISGYESGLSVYRAQPAKHAAIEGHWQTYEGNAPLILFAWPDQQGARNRNEVSIPAIGSLLATGSSGGTVHGLGEWPPEDRPNVAIVFWAFRLMVGIAIVMLILAPLGAWGAWRGWIARSRLALGALVLMIPSGLVAILAGWITAEAGRQPFTVYGVLRTAESGAPIAGQHVAISLALFVLVYICVFPSGAGIMARIASAGPKLPYRREPEPALVIYVPPAVPAAREEDEDMDAVGDEEEDYESAAFDVEEEVDPDALSDEELERLTAPSADDDAPSGVSAHDRLFMPDVDDDENGKDEDCEDDTDDDLSKARKERK